MAQHVVYYLFHILLLSMLPAFDATDCNRRRGYCPVGLDCNRNNSLCESPQTRCGLGANRTDQGITCGSNLPVCKSLQKDVKIIENFSDPLVIGAACAAVNQITTKSVSTYKSVLVTIRNGTHQVVNGVKFDMMVVVALSTTCKKDSELCTSVECPIDESTKQLWMVSVVASPTKLTTQYKVLSIRQLVHIGLVSIKEIDERDFFLCSICKKIVSYLESHLDNKASRRAVKEILNNACIGLIIQKSCLDFVNKYFDKIWSAVIHKTLGKLCCDFQFCACNNDDVVKRPIAMHHTASHGDLCPEGFLCQTGDGCSSNNSLCEVGVCQPTTEENCIQGITVQFSLNQYEVKENNGPAQLELFLSRPLEYCSFAVLIKVEDVTTIGSTDYQFPQDGYMQVIVSGGADKVPFDITVKDDNILERAEIFQLSIVDVSLPHGVIIGSRQSAEVIIYDDDRSCVKIDRQTYTVRENLLFLQVTLSLSLRASYDIGVNIRCVDLNAKRYDYDPGPYRVIFRAGNTRATFRINLIDDDIYEGPEAFSFYITTFSNHVSRCEPYRSTVNILDDERTINVGFDLSSYTVTEDVGTLSPVLSLDRPSPCSITVFAELMNDTAIGGGVDCGYPLPIMYEYTFLAGETCATPVDPIPIIDDRISERDERFKFDIIRTSLPLGVQASSRVSTRITIKDNDIACSFEKEAYEIDENKGPLKLKLNLNKPATTEFNLHVYDLSNTANAGVDYTPGPYLVTFRRYSRTSNEFSVPITKDGDDIYTGNKDFNLTIVGDSLPLGLVPGDIISVKVTIVDDEYTVCFNQSNTTVVEGGRVELVLRISKPLSRSIRVNLIYSNGTGYPATPSPAPRGAVVDYLLRSIVHLSTRITTRVLISTRRDSTLEYNETFAVSLPSHLIHTASAAADCITRVDVLIINDDFTVVDFQRTFYPPLRNKNEILKPVLELSNPIDYPIQVTLQGENGTAKSGEDYVLRNHIIIIHPEDEERKEVFVDPIDDDITEILIEEFYINIVLVADGKGAPDKHVSIGRDKRTRLQIRDDDVTYVTMINGQLQFSKGIYRSVSIEIQPRVGPTHNGWLLPKETIYKFNTEIANIVRVRVCIPKPLYDERPRRVTSHSAKVVICSLTD